MAPSPGRDLTLLERLLQGAAFYLPGSTDRLRVAVEQHLQGRVALQAPGQSIAQYSVPAWHDWMGANAYGWPGEPAGSWKGWRSDSGSYRQTHLQLPAFACLVRKQVQPAYALDLRQLDGFAASKSELRDFASIDAMAVARCPDWIASLTVEALDKRLAHGEIRILNGPTTADHFTRYAWDGRTFLSNDGGSHHAAAAHYIAKRIGMPVKLTGPLHEFRIDACALSVIKRDYELFALPQDAHFDNAFHDALHALRATYYWHDLPAPYTGERAVLLPRDNTASMRVAAQLRNADVVDLGMHLGELVVRQNAPVQSHELEEADPCRAGP